MNLGLFDEKKTTITGNDITKHTGTVKSVNTELHRIYGLINSVDVGFASKEEIFEINGDLEKIRKKLEFYCGVEDDFCIRGKL